ncbi:MAG: hypothetical protein L6R40_005035, partial [Gallowayella cf. fulva]
MASRVPPSDPPPSFGPPPPDGDRHRGADIIVTQFVFTAIATVLVCLRLFVRAWITRNVGWDDIFMAITLIVTIPGTGFNIMMIREGF